MKKIFLIAPIILGIVLVIMFYRNGEPVDTIQEVRAGVVENIQIIDTVKTANGIMIYSFGETNSGKNYMYSVDMVKKTFNSYKWSGGGGHVDEDLSGTNDFTLSLQLLNEEQNVNPTLFGIIKDKNVIGLEVSTNNESVEANFYEVNNDVFFAIPFSHSVADSINFQLTVTYKDGLSAVHTLSKDKLPLLQEGKQFYLNNTDVK